MIRVCHLVDAPFLGGAEHYVSRLALGLDRRRFRSTVVLRRPDDGDRALAEWAEGLVAQGVGVTAVPMNLPFRPWHARAIVGAVEDQAPDVAHINMPGPYDGQMGLLAPLARMAGARAVITTEHLPMVAPLWKRALVRRLAYRHVDAVLTVCRANLTYLTVNHHVGRERITVIPNGVRDDFASAAAAPEVTRAQWGIDGDRVVVLFLGNLLRHKGLHRVIQALSEHADLPWHLVVAGRGPEEGRCREQLDGLGLTPRATFLGAVAGTEVASVIGASDILALPSTVEGMPYVIIEAMASGRPVVASDVYGIPELIEDGVHGRLVPPDDRGALSAALSGLITDGAARRRMGEAARERFQSEFTLSRHVELVSRVYERAAGGRR